MAIFNDMVVLLFRCAEIFIGCLGSRSLMRERVVNSLTGPVWL
jgi:hypothetical protein